MTSNGGTELLVGTYLIDLDICIPWGVRKGRPEDVGLDGQRMPKDVFHLAKRFIPRSWLAEHVTIAGKAQKALNQVASPVTFPVGKARLVPAKALQTLLETLQRFREDFDTETDLKLRNGAYDRMRQEMLERHPEFRATLEQCFPSEAEMRSRFDLRWQVFEVSLPRGGKATVISNVKAKAMADVLEQEAAKAREQVSAFFEHHRQVICSETLKACTRIVQRIAKGQIINEGTLRQIQKKADWFGKMLEIGSGTVPENVQAAIRQLRTTAGRTKAKAVREDSPTADDFKAALAVASARLEKIVDVEIRPGQYGRRLVREETHAHID